MTHDTHAAPFNLHGSTRLLNLVLSVSALQGKSMRLLDAGNAVPAQHYDTICEAFRLIAADLDRIAIDSTTSPEIAAEATRASRGIRSHLSC
jgi:hypothetical protein